MLAYHFSGLTCFRAHTTEALPDRLLLFLVLVIYFVCSKWANLFQVCTSAFLQLDEA